MTIIFSFKKNVQFLHLLSRTTKSIQPKVFSSENKIIQHNNSNQPNTQISPNVIAKTKGKVKKYFPQTKGHLVPQHLGSAQLPLTW